MYQLKIINTADISINRIANRHGYSYSSFNKFKSRCGINKRINSPCFLRRHVNIFRNLGGYVSKSLFKKELDFVTGVNNYRGVRLKNGYPVRGQRTHTNGKTSKKRLNVKK